MPDPAQNADNPTDALLKRIKQRYRYGVDKWHKNREEGQKNMRYVSGDPWDEEDKIARKGRPTVCPDELNQYVNQVVNTARQNERGIKIDPAGDQATEELAEYRENRIRAIEYACNAQQVYINGLQAAVERNIGFWKVGRVYVSDTSDEQEIVILPVMNPDAIVIDPDYKELDGSDIKWAFELERMPVEDFEAEYPDAKIQSFAATDFGEDANLWYDGKSILIASYWEVKQSPKRVGKANRVVYNRTVRQYVTNGLEILKEGAVQPGPYIPIIPTFGKEIWVDCGAGAERQLLSLVSLARDPQKSLAFVMSSMLENCGQIPKATWIGFKGQFESDEEAWATINQVYHPYVQADAVVDAATGQLLPLPQRVQLTPDFQAYSIGADICRRAIMSAMGLQALPTAAQRANQKSGVAMEKIESQQAIGSYHLIDNYERAIALTGRIVNHWLSATDVGETKRPVRLPDGKHKLVQINTDAAVIEDDHEYHFPIADDQGRYQVTVSSGPSFESQRAEGSDFANTLVSNLKGLPVTPQQAAQILALVIRLKQLGPLGDQMADIISPQQGGAAQRLGQMQQQMGMMQQQFGEMQATIQKLMLEKQGKVIEGQNKLQIARMQEDTKLAVAEINASKDANESIANREIETFEMLHQAAHDAAMQHTQHRHEKAMGAAEAATQHALANQEAQIATQHAAHQAQIASQQSAQDAAQSQQQPQQP